MRRKTKRRMISGQLNAFFEKLDCEPETTDRYMLADEDGEDTFIRIGSIAMVRVVLDAGACGRR